ncbi:MAG: response regulator [candidate division Zixibacteria bacterium]|nr:response regulator [candidate division Zixibacteria bacterium]
MRILIADDESVSRYLLAAALTKWGYEVVTTSDGDEALDELQKDDSPNLAILDWILPNRDGLEICRSVRNSGSEKILYIILLTAKGDTNDKVKGLDAGADDYIIKPFHNEELRARVKAGERIVKLELSLYNHIGILREALVKVEQLRGIIPICGSCKRVLDDDQYWLRLEEYITNRSKTEFTHSICPECRDKYFGADFHDKIITQGKNG